MLKVQIVFCLLIKMKQIGPHFDKKMYSKNLGYSNFRSTKKNNAFIIHI